MCVQSLRLCRLVDAKQHPYNSLTLIYLLESIDPFNLIRSALKMRLPFIYLAPLAVGLLLAVQTDASLGEYVGWLVNTN